MSEWRTLRMRDVMAEFHDGPHATPPPANSGPVFLGIKNITESGLLDLSDVRHIADEDFVRWTRRATPLPGDVVFTYEATLHRYALIPEGFRGCLGRRLALIRPNPSVVLPRYLHFAMLGPRWRSTVVERIIRGATVDRIPIIDFPDFPIDLPDIEAQAAVVEVLGAIDDLIENNRCRIALLEQMAQAIYREWFVQFRYRGHEAGELVDSSLGPIPEGWNTSTLGDRLDVLESGSRPRGGIDPQERGAPSVGAENILGLGRYRFEAEKYVSESFYESMRRGRVEDGDVLLYKDGAHIGRHSLFRDGFPHSRCVINEHVFRLRARPPLTQSYLYFWIDRPETVEDIVSLNSNAAQPGLSQAKLATLAMVVPTAGVLKDWDAAVEPLLELLFGLAKQNRQLAEMRDLLLPGLVSGAIDVAKFDLDALLDETAA